MLPIRQRQRARSWKKWNEPNVKKRRAAEGKPSHWQTERRADVATPSPEGRLIAGLQPVREAIRAHGSTLLRVVVELGDSPRLAAVERFARDQGVASVVRSPRAELDRLSRGVLHQGALAWALPLTLTPFDELKAQTWPVAVALDGIQDPQNFGACVRSAVALAKAPVLWPEHAAAPLSAATVRASAGAIERATLCQVPSLHAALLELAEAGGQVVGLAAEATRPLGQLDLTRRTVLVLGSEHRGLSRPVRSACTELAGLPMAGGGVAGGLASLNASVALGIALYEWVRQAGSS
jgi:23S rRNA (guanosine2251-2'-O)-methyltransferase